ncbi:hypothetical protein BGP_0413 [Beggiatoa sp. PS]|nr:hypothetical protein BGP_0413 [Beggiatoa sp. PS]
MVQDIKISFCSLGTVSFFIIMWQKFHRCEKSKGKALKLWQVL